jgi:hypothetical protein
MSFKRRENECFTDSLVDLPFDPATLSSRQCLGFALTSRDVCTTTRRGKEETLTILLCGGTTSEENEANPDENRHWNKNRRSNANVKHVRMTAR